MKGMNRLRLAFLPPALIVIALLFLTPVIVTGFFAFTKMSAQPVSRAATTG